jgi:hypothetical protein
MITKAPLLPVEPIGIVDNTDERLAALRHHQLAVPGC